MDEKKHIPNSSNGIAATSTSTTADLSGSTGGAVPEVDCTNAGRGVWLVKVPKYIASRWETLGAGKEVGRLKISTTQQGTKDITFDLSEDLIAAKPMVTTTSIMNGRPITSTAESPAAKIPRKHRFQISDITHQTLAVLSQDSSKRLAIEGNVVQKGECRPIEGDKNYMQLKSEAIRKAREPVRTVQQLDRAVNNYKPISAHKADVEFERVRKEQGKKSRDDRDKVQEVLFGAFEKHQYYNIKDLEKITRQPIPYLKDILKEICHYNAKNPHRNMWELKPEYRHYKSTPANPATEGTTSSNHGAGGDAT